MIQYSLYTLKDKKFGTITVRALNRRLSRDCHLILSVVDALRSAWYLDVPCDQF